MSNKIERKEEGKQYINVVVNASEISRRRIFEPSERIFPPPSFMFEVRDDRKLSEKKNNFANFNSFKPKLQTKSLRRQTTGHGKRSNTRDKRRIVDTKNNKNTIDHVRNDINVEKEVDERRQQLKTALALKNPQDRKQGQNEKDIIEITETEDLSPYAKYSTNSFPKKQIKTVYPRTRIVIGRNQYLSELNLKMRKSLGDKLEDPDMKLSQIQSKNILQVMTIFSIKQTKEPDRYKDHKSVKETYSRKREMLQNLMKDKKPRIKIKQKKYMRVDEEPDISLDKVYFKKIYSFLYFVNKVRYANNIPISNIVLNQRYNGEKVKVFVGNGNNKYLIIALLRRRFWFQVTWKINNQTKFIWTQNSIKDVHAIQRKKKIVRNLTEKSEKRIQEGVWKQNPEIQMADKRWNQKKNYNSQFFQTYTSLTFDSPSKTTSKLNKNQQPQKDQNKKLFLSPIKLSKADILVKPLKIQTKKKTQQYKIQDIITNHIPNNSFIGSKKALFYTMQHYYRNIKKTDPFKIIPKTYHFKNNDDQSYNLFIQNQKQINQKSLWIVKPGQCSNRGTGIQVLKANDISRKLLKKQNHANGQPKTAIVQSYITDPFLYHGRKFDIRHFMMITTINGNLKAYWYSQGYLRTTSQHFSLQKLDNIYIHLTNDAIQKNYQKYGKYEPGNKVSYSQFQRYLDNSHAKKNINFKEKVINRMKEIATDIIRANYQNMDKDRKMNNFQIFGLDFMIDKEFKVWLIQVNANPCLQINCPLMSRIIPTMVEHSLRLGLDPLILPPSHYPPNNRYYLSDNFVENLRYEIIFDELEQKQVEDEMKLAYDFQFDEPEDEYQNEGTDIDLTKILD